MGDWHFGVELTDDRRTIALETLADHVGGPERLEEAFRRWKASEVLVTRYRIEADMIVVLAEAMRQGE
jgi:hypothetical protein